ncbi:MAG: hypothetical protein R3B67_01980 [Phycisphaerales bacterium]
MSTPTTEATQDQAVIITETAAREIKNIIETQELDLDKVRLRVGVKGGGCSGFSYLLDLTDQKDSDELFEQHQDHHRSQIPALPVRRHRRFQGRAHGTRVFCLQQPQRHQQLRLRLELRGLSLTTGKIRQTPREHRGVFMFPLQKHPEYA